MAGTLLLVEDDLAIATVITAALEDEGFTINESKTRLLRASSRQTVTGLVVNDQLSTPRQLRRRLRAILHNAQTTGLDAQNRDNHEDFHAYLLGMIGFVEQASVLGQSFL